MSPIHDLHESHIGAIRKTLVAFDTRPKPLHRRGFHIGHLQHRMRIAHGYRAELDLRAVDPTRIVTPAEFLELVDS